MALVVLEQHNHRLEGVPAAGNSCTHSLKRTLLEIARKIILIQVFFHVGQQFFLLKCKIIYNRPFNETDNLSTKE